MSKSQLLFSVLYLPMLLGGELCAITGKEAQPPGAHLQFCSMFRSSACCNAATDSQIQEYYTDMIHVSDLCAARQTRAHISLKYLFCFACSPNQPKATNESTLINICSSIVDDIDLAEFDSCGMVVPEERGNLCAGDDTFTLTFRLL